MQEICYLLSKIKKNVLVSIVLGMTLHGFGLGASVVGGFSDAHKSAIK